MTYLLKGSFTEWPEIDQKQDHENRQHHSLPLAIIYSLSKDLQYNAETSFGRVRSLKFSFETLRYSHVHLGIGCRFARFLCLVMVLVSGVVDEA